MGKRIHHASAQHVRLENGVRTRFQRLTDCRFFSGWVQDVYGDKVTVLSSPGVAIQNGQVFQFDVFSPELVGAFMARLDYGGDMSLISGDETKDEFEMRQRILAAADLEYEFTIVSDVLARPSYEEARYLTQICKAQVHTDSGDIDGTMVDASASGIGLILPNAALTNSRVSARIQTHVGEIFCSADVKYCRADRQFAHSYRVGLQIVEMDRIARARWVQLQA